MKKKKSLDELKKIAGRAQHELSVALQAQSDAVLLPKLRKTVGKCFRYINSYGGHLTKWPLYVKVLSIDEKRMTFKVIEFQRTSMEIVEVKLDTEYNYNENHFDNRNYIEISATEYNRAKRALLKFITAKLSL